MSKKIIFLLLSLSLTSTCFTGIGNWKSLTSKKEIRSITVRNGIIWSATSGGIFSYNSEDSSYTNITTSEGLKTIDVSSIAIDKNNSVWIGAKNGYIHNYQPSKSSWNYFSDIFLSNSPQKSINNLYALGDTLLISSSLGVSVLLITKNQFADSYTKFGPTQQISGNVNASIIFNDTIWIATNNGIAAAGRSNPNLIAPQSWKIFQTNNGLPSNTVKSIAVFKNRLYAATRSGLVKYGSSTWQTVSGTFNKNILAIASGANNLFFITESELWKVNIDETISLVDNAFPSILTTVESANGNIFIGTQNDGVSLITSGTKLKILPSGPPTNILIGLAVDDNGNLWAGTGETNGKGIVRFDGKDWHQYNVDTHPILIDPNYYQVNIGNNNTKWASGFGAGAALISNDNQIIKVFNTRNGLPPTLINPPTYVVVAGVVTDKAGNSWINVRTGRGDTLLSVFRKDSTFTYAKSPVAFVSTGITIDENDTKWLWGGGGILFYNENERLTGAFSGSNWGKVSKTNGLSSDNISVVTVDNEGEIWAGTTDAGISIIYNAKNPINRIASYFPLRDQKINDILVDPLNQKWIATPKGIFVLSRDGTSILQQFTAQNTSGKLLDDNVFSIAMNRNNGLIYFGTEKGISVLQTGAIAPSQNLDNIITYPSPFIIPSTTLLTIDGLVLNSSLKILSVDGRIINEITTIGGRIGFWDGTDDSGNLVASGIYIIAAYSENGNKIGMSKIAVIRK